MTTKINLSNLDSTTVSAFARGPSIANVQIADSSYTVLDDTAVDVAGGYIVINGSNFYANSTVFVDAVAASAVSYVNSTQLRAQVAARSSGSYVVYVVNYDGSTAVRVNGLTYSSFPAFTSATSLVSTGPDTAFSVQLGTIADSTVVYTVDPGSSLPSGLSLSSSGVLSGVLSPSVDTTYNFVIVATDAENQNTSKSFSVTIVVSEPYARYNTLLLSPTAPTATFVTDASTNNFAITVVGDARPNNFGPYQGVGYYSNYFDGTGDYLTAGSSVSLSSNFTVECWVYGVSYGSNGFYLYGLGNDIGTGGATFFISTSGYLRIYTNNSNLLSSTGSSITLNSWNHVAFVRNSGTVIAYLNGVQVDSASWTGTISGLSHINAELNGSPTATTYVGGACYISNHRVVTSAVYTSNFTPSTSPLTAITNTQLLTCTSNRLVDNSTNNLTITKNGDTTVSGFIPFLPGTSYSSLGSGYFDGTGDYLSGPTTTNINLSTGDWTIECWAYTNSGVWVTSYLSSGTGIAVTGNVYYLSSNGSTWNLASGVSIGTWVANQWNHFALVRYGNVITPYINGVAGTSTTTSSALYMSGQSWGIGNNAQSFTSPIGYMSDFRMVKGTAVYTAAFTPPTAPLTAITNTSLLTLQNNQPNNNSMFVDSSTNNFTITRAGNATQGSFTPYRPVWGNFFNSGTYLTISGATNLNIGTSDFTIEAWINWSSLTSGRDNPFIGASDVSWSFTIIQNNLSSGTTYQGRIGVVTGDTIILFGTTVTVANTWYHVSVSRSGSNLMLFVNGTLESSTTYSSSFSLASSYVGWNGYAYSWDTRYYNGYISNLRVIKGTALYTANFTPSTAPLTAITNTQLLTCNSGRFADTSSNAYAMTVNGSVSLRTEIPLSFSQTYTPATYGGSAYFDGTGDYLTVADNAILELGSSNFCVEMFYYPISVTGARTLLSKRSNPSTDFGFLFYANGSNMTIYISSANSSYDIANGVSIGTLILNQWHHISVYRVGNAWYGSLNGTITTINANSSLSVWNNTAAWGIGAESNGVNSVLGYISDVRMVIGSSVYTTSNFVPPTAPLAPVKNSTLLLNMTSAAIYDSAMANNLETVGDAKITTVAKKYGSTSMAFDGTGDYLNIPSSVNTTLGSGNFTIEFWFYTATSQTGNLFDQRSTATQATPVIYLNAGVLIYYLNGAAGITGSSVTTSQWNHVAVCRSGSNTKMFLNGTQTGSTLADSNNYVSAPIGIGAYPVNGTGAFTGYISDLRVTRGYARYTANFTAPTGPLVRK